MLIKNDEQTELQFGNGDIRMASTVTTDGVGYITFENHDAPGVINQPTYNQDTFSPENYPILMSFTKIESIDSLIGQLLYAKENMIKLKNMKEEQNNGK
ncbi:hypothetical protein [Clostridium estertheticum]|uniref:hypothetical protein n=1 Tax=Clostridium estertheticum TaxID=238834 RepID=UPI001C0C26D5|nr:hypothetical protein [Clostridium estertheticum]MBU3186519.1 hypothetical protein [Clostridium estertheticum]